MDWPTLAAGFVCGFVLSPYFAVAIICWHTLKDEINR